jgi:hypothetical protein
MEYWKSGFRGIGTIKIKMIFSSSDTHYSTIPTLHYSRSEEKSKSHNNFNFTSS